MRFPTLLFLGLSLSHCALAAPTEPVETGTMAYAGPSVAGKQLALGKAHGCSLDAAIDGVRCWGDDRMGQIDVPVLASPTFIAAGGDTSCAISSGLVRCWGDGSRGQRNVPLELGRPAQLAVGDGHVCALQANGQVRCWGDDSRHQLQVPRLSTVEAIAAGAHHTCALGAGQVTCWGDDTRDQLKLPPLASVTALAVGGDEACAIDSGKVVCWGGVPALREQIPALEAPRLIAVGATNACALDAHGVQCWGDPLASVLTPPELTMPTQLAVGGADGYAHACARHLQGVQCWGANHLNQATYDGGAYHVLHHSESRIAADSERIWAILMDLARYPEWNPYTIAMKSTLQIGAPMVMTVKMNDAITRGG